MHSLYLLRCMSRLAEQQARQVLDHRLMLMQMQLIMQMMLLMQTIKKYKQIEMCFITLV